jgi:hypothetical protein
MVMYKIAVFIPEEALEAVKNAMFAAGAGRIGNYDRCCWQVPGQGQFRPLKGSRPYLGEQDQIETVKEYKVEMVCADACMAAVIRAMKIAHPYEEPAFDVWQLADILLETDSISPL